MVSLAMSGDIYFFFTIAIVNYLQLETPCRPSAHLYVFFFSYKQNYGEIIVKTKFKEAELVFVNKSTFPNLVRFFPSSISAS